MNKFKYLQIVGTITVLSPIILVTLATLIYVANSSNSVEVEEVVEVEKKQDTVKPVVLINQPVPVKPAPVVVVTPVIKDTVKSVVNTLDTTK